VDKLVFLYPFSTEGNQHLFNNTRKFFRRAGVNYTADMKRKTIVVNNGNGSSAFILAFEDYSYIRASRIPKASLEILFQANTPEFIVKKLFDYRFLQFYEVVEIVKNGTVDM
jgi:predicted Rossmann-fold nucleotide-binding protein